MAGSIVRLKLWNDSEHQVTEWAPATKNHEWNSLLMNKQMFINEASLEKVIVFIHYSLAPNVNLCDNVLIQGMSQSENQKQIFLSLWQHKCPPHQCPGLCDTEMKNNKTLYYRGIVQLNYVFCASDRKLWENAKSRRVLPHSLALLSQKRQ